MCWRWYCPQEDLTYYTNVKKEGHAWNFPELIFFNTTWAYRLFSPIKFSGLADLVGRRFGIQKIPYNRNKSFSGSLAMAVAGFLASIG